MGCLLLTRKRLCTPRIGGSKYRWSWIMITYHIHTKLWGLIFVTHCPRIESVPSSQTFMFHTHTSPRCVTWCKKQFSHWCGDDPKKTCFYFFFVGLSHCSIPIQGSEDGEIQESPWNNTVRDHLTKSRFFS
jgi:hypothetical protein